MEKSLKKIIAFVLIFFVTVNFVGCSNGNSKSKKEIEKFDIGDTATYKSDDNENVVDITVDELDEISEESASDVISSSYGKYIRFILTLKCKKGEIKPSEFFDKKVTVTDAKGNVADGLTLEKNTIPEKIKKGQTIKIFFVYGLRGEPTSAKIDLKNFRWSGKIRPDPTKESDDYN